jgi:hypothetical protein
MTLFQAGQLEIGTCLSLLARTSIGRVGLVIGPLPFIYPARYDMSGGHILFGVSIDQVASALDDAVVALQADGYDEDKGSHWTVLAIGPATSVETRSESVPGHLRSERHVFRLRPKMISGHWLETTGNDG